MNPLLKSPYGLKQSNQKAGLRWLAAVLMVAGLVMISLYLVSPYLQSRAAQTWVETPCRIISSRVEAYISYGWRGSVHTNYTLSITYAYHITGQRYDYQSSRYDFTFSSGDHEWLDSVVRQNPADKITVCYVNPQNSAEAVLSRSFHSSLMGLLVGSGLLIGAGLLLLLPAARWGATPRTLGPGKWDL